MIPSVVATQVKHGLEDFLRTTFPPGDPFFAAILENFFNEPNALFRGPFLSLKLPFRPGTGKADELYPEFRPMRFSPYLHQELAFERLSDETPRSTLIATGTGSGKTECFMYPLLDYCYRHRGEPGVKAIIIYPMNALATDQARRFAREIFCNENLKGNVSAGLFIGQQADADGFKCMTEDSIITCKETMRQHPPDILMTNYKMLDFLLLRPKDYPLWQLNEPETLKYIAVDELHTFDGAQGTDLACLLRRLMSRLKTPPDHICFVGTSATLGNGSTGRNKMLSFAGKVFGTEFDPDAIITEDVLKPGEFLGDDLLIRNHPIPDESKLDKLNSKNYETEAEYLSAQSRLWFGDAFALSDDSDSLNEGRCELGRHLREHVFFQNLIRLLNNETQEEEVFSQKLDQVLPGFSKKSQDFQEAFIDSIFALISFAHRKVETGDGRGEVAAPFLQVRFQLWLREMSRMVATIEDNPRLRYAADLRKDEPVRTLPLVHCRNCGHVGYLGVMPATGTALSSDLQRIYSAFFAHAPTLQYVFHDDGEEKQMELTSQYLCGHCLSVFEGQGACKCPSCGKDDALLKVHLHNPRVQNSNGIIHVYHDCPFCGGKDSLAIIGSRSASLTSVVISQLFSSPYNDDPKLLAFSDSVQDASHRAGFFSARTYHFNFRAAVQQLLEQTDQTLTLESLPQVFVDFWEKRLRGEAAFVAQFIPPEMQADEDFDELLATGEVPEKSGLLQNVRKRIEWEILSEYGYRGQVGRTLEKSGCSIIRLSGNLLEQWAKEVHRVQTEENGFLRNASVDDFKRFLVAFVRMMRLKGAIAASYLLEYMKSGNTFMLSMAHPFMPNFGWGRAPAFPVFGKGGPARFDPLIGSGRNPTAYQILMTRCLGNLGDTTEDVFATILASGCKLGILTAVQGTDHAVYGLNPAALEIEKQVDQFQCEYTKRLVPAPHSEKAFWDGMPTPLSTAPEAILRFREENFQDYYGKLYRQGKVHRVVAKEHTGLLDRPVREKLESSFIKGTDIGAPNVLSCTPTLEMGINIGDLSTVILCSMPPAQANYVQRIGRAGRRDGNAFNFVVAAQKPHDLHFFSEPMEMISGEVLPPGVFLNAPAVLERQLTAFCFDRWVESTGGETSQMAPNLRAALDAVSSQNQEKFPYTLLKFIDLRRMNLLKEFYDIFPDVLANETKQHLHDFLRDSENDGVDRRILGRLESAQKSRKALQDKVKSIRKKLSALDKRPEDEAVREERNDLLIEKSALQTTLVQISNKHILEFFTDEGLLPNYAFPEAGVTLRSIIYRRRRKRGEGDPKYETFTNEYERSGRTAIVEFAPGNTFYVDGRKLTINRIDMTDTEVERWHFCGSCNHVEKVTDDQHAAVCPKCGSPTWADGNLVRNVLRIKRVISNLSDRKSRSYDESDEREPSFYNRHMMAEFSPQYIEKAYKIPDQNFPFGFEFLRKATFREVNFGDGSIEEGNDIEIAAHRVSRDGFRVCKECGAVAFNGKEFKHDVTCRHYGKAGEKGVIECLYLYREFESEALRLLLPLEDINFDSNIQSFIAALYMGLKERFEGSVDHLQVMIHDEPVPDSAMRKRYLVLFDQIPGGTGYLKQLATNSEDFMSMIQSALEKLQHCRCQSDPDKDGCYSCLYAYRVSRDLPNISRRAAIDLLARLAARRSELEETDTIEKISVNALFESDLEKRFVEGLRRCSSGILPVEVDLGIFDGKTGYRITVHPSEEESYSYKLVPQVEIGSADGVSVPSRADFVIYPLRGSQVHLKPIAVFTDGFQFHGDLKNGNYRFHKDLSQRMALAKSGKFHCWSLSYQDVMTKFDNEHENGILSDKIAPRAFLLESYLLNAEKKNPLDLLVTLLAHPDEKAFRHKATMYAMACSKAGRQDYDSLMKTCKDFLHSDAFPPFPQKAPTGNAAFWGREITVGSAKMTILSTLRNEDARMPERVRIAIRLADNDSKIENGDFQILWNNTLQAYNLLQFLPGATIITDRFVQERVLLPDVVERPAFAGGDDASTKWREISEVIEDFAQPVLTHAKESGWSLPEPGYELANASGTVEAMAELAWQDRHLAVIDDADREGREIFQAQGWKVVSHDELTDLGKYDSLFTV